MSVMLTLMSTRPILASSGSSEVWMLCRNFSRSRLMSSMPIEAMTWRSWPRIMSLACCLMSSALRPRRRMAACCIGFGCGSNFDGVGADDAEDDDVRPCGKLLLRGDCLVFDGAVEDVDMDLAGPGLGAGDREIDGALRAERPLDAESAVHVQTGQHA